MESLQSKLIKKVQDLETQKQKIRQQSAAALEESLKVLEGLRNDVKAKTEEILRKQNPNDLEAPLTMVAPPNLIQANLSNLGEANPLQQEDGE